MQTEEVFRHLRFGHCHEVPTAAGQPALGGQQPVRLAGPHHRPVRLCGPNAVLLPAVSQHVLPPLKPQLALFALEQLFVVQFEMFKITTLVIIFNFPDAEVANVLWFTARSYRRIVVDFGRR